MLGAAALELVEAAGLVPAGAPEDRLALGFTDLDDADRLRRAYGPALIFVVGKGWGWWTGTHWDFREGRHRAKACAARLRDLLLAEAKAYARREIDELAAQRFLQDRREQARGRSSRQGTLDIPEDIEAAKAMMRREGAAERYKHAERCGQLAKINAALELLEASCLEPLDNLDNDPWRLAAPNGVIDLRKAAVEAPEAEEPEERVARRKTWLTPPDRELRNTRVLGAAFDPEADCPRFRAFLELIQPDPAHRGYLQRCLGLTVFGENFLQIVLLLRGSGGNGKSTLLAVLRDVLGGYVASARIEMFLAGRDERAGQATPEEVELPGARAIIATEPDPGDVLSAKKVKSLTGGDPRPARALNMPQFIYTPSGLPILSFNRTPRIKGEDEGFWRRLEFLLFEVELHKLEAGARRDLGEVRADLAEEGPGILNWLLDGFAAVRSLGLQPPPNIVRMKAELRGASDPVGEFFADCIEDADSNLAIREAYQAFTAWCELNGMAPVSDRYFGRLIDEKGLADKHRVKGVRYLKAKRLNANAPTASGDWT